MFAFFRDRTKRPRVRNFILFGVMLILPCVTRVDLPPFRSLVHYPEGKERKSRLMTFTPTSGLGNSMIGLVSVSHLAELLDMNFAVDWHEHSAPSCSAAYADIFLEQAVKHPDNGTLACSRKCTLDLTQNGEIGCWEMITCDRPASIKHALEQCDCVNVRTNQFFLPLLARHSNQDVVDDFKRHAKKHLQPARTLARSVSGVRRGWERRYDITYVIGIHVRTAFNHAGIQGGHFIPKNGVFERIFWPCIQTIIEELPHETIGVFVAADTPEARGEAASILKADNRVVELPSPLRKFPNDTGLGPQRSKAEVLDAALELFLLQQSDALFVQNTNGRFSSTFSASAMSLADCSGSTSCFLVGERRCEKARSSIVPDAKKVKPACRDAGRCHALGISNN